jgi:hypothetical protein
MTGNHALPELAALPGSSLEEVTATADLQVRTDRKYLVDPALLPSIVDAVADEARVLTIDGLTSFRYESTYFDTPDFCTYLAAARSRPQRYKLRTRAYVDSDACQFEVKVRSRGGVTTKHRHPYEFAARDALTDEAERFIATVPEVGMLPELLHRSLCIRYVRSTLLLPGPGVRATIDLGLCATRPDGAAVRLPSVAFVETKTPGPPSVLDRVLWRAGLRPVAASKYCIGLAALVPELPANKWHRILRRHELDVSQRSRRPLSGSSQVGG